jgi:hypothetical protein
MATEPMLRKSALEIMISEMQQHNVNVELKQKMPDGTYQHAADDTIESLSVKSKIASVAQGIHTLSKLERTAWAITTKDKANEMFEQELYKDAMEVYLQALVASDFGGNDNTSFDNNNIDTLVVPVLCNLAVCCMKLNV